MFETRWRNLKRLKLRLWFFLTYHGNFPEAIHLGEMSHTQKVTSMWATAICPLMGKTAPILCFHSRGQHLCKFIGTKESVYIRKEFNSHRTGLGHKHGRRFIVLGHKYGRHDVMWKHTILVKYLSRPGFCYGLWWSATLSETVCVGRIQTIPDTTDMCSPFT